MGRSSVFFAVILPLIGLVTAITRGEMYTRSGTEWRFAIEGYDPRDLLRGRYLQFRIREDWTESISMCGTADCCACLVSQGGHRPPRLQPLDCEVARLECRAFVQLDELDELNRYYVPEAKAAELEQRLREAAQRQQAVIVVSVTKNGRVTITDLELDGVSVDDL